MHPDSIMPDTLQIIPLYDRPYFPVLINLSSLTKSPGGLVLRLSLKALINWLGSVLHLI